MQKTPKIFKYGGEETGYDIFCLMKTFHEKLTTHSYSVLNIENFLTRVAIESSLVTKF